MEFLKNAINYCNLWSKSISIHILRVVFIIFYHRYYTMLSMTVVREEH